MRFLADQDVYAATTLFLRSLGHDVVTARDLGLSTSPDSQLLQTAHESGRIFLTRDRDFGGLVFAGGQAAGVLYLRVLPATMKAVHAELSVF